MLKLDLMWLPALPHLAPRAVGSHKGGGIAYPLKLMYSSMRKWSKYDG